MENEKDIELEADTTKKEEHSNESASRARNRTVMLTPEMTSQVRSRFAQDTDTGYPSNSQAARPSSALDSVSSGGFYTPTSASARPSQREPVAAFPSAAHRAEPAHQVAAAPVHQGEGIMWVKESPVIGFLVAYDVNPNGSVYELRSGRLMITSQAAAGENTLILNDSSVSPMHAILRVSQSGEIQVLDQLSEFGTKIKRFGSEEEEVLSGEKSTLEHGDIVTFGSRCFHVCIIPRSNQA